jgi:hypothetical protein
MAAVLVEKVQTKLRPATLSEVRHQPNAVDRLP